MTSLQIAHPCQIKRKSRPFPFGRLLDQRYMYVFLQLLEALSKLYSEQKRYSEALEVVTKLHLELMMVFTSEGAERLNQVEGMMKE